MSRLISVAAFALALGSALPGFTAAPAQTGTATLSCGPARLVARTTSVAHVGPDDGLAWTSQQITLRTAPNGPARRLRVEGDEAAAVPGVYGGLSAIVSSWTCLHASKGNVIELWLTCNRSDQAGVCGGQREWERLLDTKGRRLDKKYAPQDPRYESLSARLGISTDGVELKAATGN